MADAMVMGAEAAPDAIIDIATLTGAAMRALGTDIAAVMGTDTALVETIKTAGEATGEPVWQLSMGPGYRAELDSDVADLKNLGGDIAGVAATATPKGWKTRGMSGFGARLLVDVLERIA
jgi:leucyl aminopeptidase